MEKRIFNGIEYNIYTGDDWETDGTLNVKEGDVIAPWVYYQLRGCLPPKRDGHIFQVGEPYTHDKNGVALYDTFECVKSDYYKYIGLRP